jgi:hypothetical protein
MKTIRLGFACIAMLLLPAAAPGQSGTAKLELPWSTKMATVATITPLRATTTGVGKIPGQAQQISLTGLVLQARDLTFPGQSGADMVVVGFRLEAPFAPGNWKGSIIADLILADLPQPQPPIKVAKGTKLFARMSWSFPTAQGDLDWAPDAASLPTRIAVSQPGVPVIGPDPAPVVPPPVVVAPPPAACTPDAVGTVSPPAAQLTSADCASWVLKGSTITRNGVDTKNPFTAPGDTLSISTSASSVHVITRDHGFNCWNGSAWVGSGC